MIAPKPTTYRDTHFRSRLEARWAAFFDLAGWRWDYEPFDLDGWVPDFRLKGSNNNLLVEVKPIEWGHDPALVLQANDVTKILAHRKERFVPDAWRDELLVLGNGPQRIGADYVLGVFADDTWCVSPDWAVLAANENDETELDFYCRNGSFGYRMRGDWDGNAHIRDCADAPAVMWRHAGGMTQWRGAAAAPHSGPIGPHLQKIIDRLNKDQP